MSDHPRMRGEDSADRFPRGRIQGSPPHARGRPVRDHGVRISGGITPACAGKTRQSEKRNRRFRDHPRMRGEDAEWLPRLSSPMGSPPHARGRLFRLGPIVARQGITPACAGKTIPIIRVPWNRRDHPRMRGEDRTLVFGCVRSPGSPPHARGRPIEKLERERDTRITPACAGKT